jgi:hypothetical protein
MVTARTLATLVCSLLPGDASSLAAGMPSEDTLHRMAEDIIDVVVRRLINEIDHVVFDEEQ